MMEFRESIVLVTLFLSVVTVVAAASASASMLAHHEDESHLDRRSFPEGFIFGASSAAYQYEGAAKEGSKGPSIWDTFTQAHPEKIADGSNGDVAVDQYHRYKEDVLLMKEMGIDAYRFSISWPRILPNGNLSGGINKEGIDYYNNLIDELLSQGLQPFVTLFHWDTPQGLDEQYGSFLSPRIVKDYHDYVEVCFREFGDRVKHWITFNEPHVFTDYGYASGIFAPGRCSSWEIGRCKNGDSGKEPYIVGHHILLAHAAAVDLYRNKFQKTQNGKIGMTLDCNWMVPYSDSKSNGDAVERGLDFVFGWFMDPLTQGDYPFNMRALVGDRLPKFTEQQSNLIKGSFDFIGLNYYSTSYVYSLPIDNTVNKSYNTDSYTTQTALRNGIPIGPKPGTEWIYVYPQGIQDLLLYTKTKYNNPVIYITENGLDEKSNENLSLKEALKDDVRIDYYRQHIIHVQRAISKGVDVRGYFAWSLLDNFEWASGYSRRYGIYYVDYIDGLKRHPKSSALWFQRFLSK
ncbi:beta-glucosidase 12-like [Iris pallida]|uniref:Beta-glucosidase 12-like n=1 Tax=Iris pallida TaxID=29817 RepID=A0AAX6EIN1_IRIPA|nr:beta-glucosidase 12-like [Iris pallida]